jgi:DNA-binding transcriptional ArsR family regulator
VGAGWAGISGARPRCLLGDGDPASATKPRSPRHRITQRDRAPDAKRIRGRRQSRPDPRFAALGAENPPVVVFAVGKASVDEAVEGGHVGFVGVTHGVAVPGIELFWSLAHVHGGPAPVSLLPRAGRSDLEPARSTRTGSSTSSCHSTRPPPAYEAMDELARTVPQPRRTGIVNPMVQYPPTVDRAFAALADPTRRAVLERLGVGSATISELAEPFGMSLTGMKKHVRVLEEAQLVTTEKVGRVRRCTLVPYAFEGISTWLQRLDRFAQVVERTKGAT